LLRDDIKRWTLWDVGELLDKALAQELLDSKQEFDPLKHKPLYFSKDIKPEDLWWNTWIFDGYG